MQPRALILPLIFAGLAAGAFAQHRAPRAASPAPRISLETLKSVDQMLSSDEYEGRAPTTHGEELTVNHIAQRFRQAGLRPGNQGSWFQNVALAENSASPTALTIAGGSTPLTFNYRTDFVANSYQLQPRIDVADSDIVFVGYGINAPELGWNDYAGVDVRGKTVIVLVNDPDWRSSALQGTFRGRAMTYYGRWTYKYEEAARQGAAAVFIVHQTEPASYGWNVVQSSWTGPQYNTDDTNNMDSLNLAGAARDFVSIGGGKSELDPYLARAAAAQNMRVSAEPNPEAGYYFRSDQFSLAKMGVPMLYGRGGEDLVNGGSAAGAAAAADYRAHRYHQPSDEYDPNWDWAGAVNDVAIYYRVGRELATSRAWPNWLPGDEFRAIRDRSRPAQ